MEGLLLVPPDRGTIIGRAVWKSRFVVLGSSLRLPPPKDAPPLPRSSSSGRLQAARKGLISAPSRPIIDEMGRSTPDQLWLSVYKQKGDWEALSQHTISAIKSVEIQSIQYRKPGPALPTLVITLEPDPVAEKSRKRRSSRTGGLSSSNSFPNCLLFRTLPDERYNIYDWQIAVQPMIRPNSDFDSPMSPTSPQFNSFANPFAPRPLNTERTNSASSRPELHHRGSSNTYNSLQGGNNRENRRPSTSALISPSPSLRSKTSDLSSQASSLNRPQGYHSSFPIQHPPNDLPSPASTTGYEDQFISGWTSAQGRSSALSTHTRGSNSVSMAGTPPAPRETILDRAFQMRVIPGSDRSGSGEEENGRLSSIARFEALMREIDERTTKGKRASANENAKGKDAVPNWGLDEESDDESGSEVERPVTRDEDDFQLEEEDEETGAHVLSIEEIPTPAQRALEYISGRGTSGRTTPAARRRPSPSPSARTTPTLPPHVQESKRRRPRPMSMALPSSSHDFDITPTASSSLKRRSSTSTKRLSFNEFAKRLSSTSSLLLVQTNASSSSGASRHSRCSSEASFVADTDEQANGVHRGLSQSRLSGMAGSSGMNMGQRAGAGDRDSQMSTREKRCGWRGSGLGVFGSESRYA